MTPGWCAVAAQPQQRREAAVAAKRLQRATLYWLWAMSMWHYSACALAWASTPKTCPGQGDVSRYRTITRQSSWTFWGPNGLQHSSCTIGLKKKKNHLFREPYFLRIFYFIFSKEIFIAFICKWKHDVNVYVMALGARLSHQLWSTRETFLFLA